MPELGGMLNKLAQLIRITDGGLGAEPAGARGYRVWKRSPHPWAIIWKNSNFMPFWITFHTPLEPFERAQFLRFENQLKKFNCSVFPLQVESKTRLKSRILG